MPISPQNVDLRISKDVLTIKVEKKQTYQQKKKCFLYKKLAHLINLSKEITCAIIMHVCPIWLVACWGKLKYYIITGIFIDL